MQVRSKETQTREVGIKGERYIKRYLEIELI